MNLSYFYTFITPGRLWVDAFNPPSWKPLGRPFYDFFGAMPRCLFNAKAPILRWKYWKFPSEPMLTYGYVSIAKCSPEIDFSRLENWKINFYTCIGLKNARMLNKMDFEKAKNGPELDFLPFSDIFLAVSSIY